MTIRLWQPTSNWPVGFLLWKEKRASANIGGLRVARNREPLPTCVVYSHLSRIQRAHTGLKKKKGKTLGAVRWRRCVPSRRLSNPHERIFYNPPRHCASLRNKSNDIQIDRKKAGTILDSAYYTVQIDSNRRQLFLIYSRCATRAGGTGGNRYRHATPLWAASVILGIFFRINAICYRKMAIG
jgi:hypothetical protein